MKVKVDTLVPRGVVHDFVPSGHYNTSVAGTTKPENEVCWQLVVNNDYVHVCYAGRYERIHGDGLVRVITDVLTSPMLTSPSAHVSSEGTAQMIANTLRDKGLVK